MTESKVTQTSEAVIENSSRQESMHWEKLISDKRLGLEQYHDPQRQIRSDFQRDYDRLIFSSPFRRLQNKTQVFPLPGSIFVHNRLTHSLEVSSVGRSMAREAAVHLSRSKDFDPALSGDMSDIVAASCLCHDLGNPPFGHGGEKTISTFFSEGAGQSLRSEMSANQWSDLIHFEGNANSFRLLTHQFVGRRKGGFAMTYSTLASVVKYPWDSVHAGDRPKFGYFNADEGVYRAIADELGIVRVSDGVYARHPLVYLMEAADDICYQIMDMEDAHRLGILPAAIVTELLMNFFDEERRRRASKVLKNLDDPNEQVAYLRSGVIGALVGECARVFAENQSQILQGSFRGSLIGNSTGTLKQAYDECAATAAVKIYRAPQVVEVEIAGNRIITYLLEVFTDAVMNPEKNFSRLLLETVPRQYDMRAQGVYERILSVLDHISGMTDVYALNLFRKLNGHSLPAV